MDVKISLLYATRRPHCVASVVNMWDSRAGLGQPEIVIAVDDNDAASQAQALPRAHKLVAVRQPHNCVHAWNDAAMASTGELLVVISDDFIPPYNWDVALLSALLEARAALKRDDLVLLVNDGLERTLCTLPVLTRQRFDRFGYVFFPGYESMFCDTELTARAQLDSVLVDARHILFEHLHHNAGRRAADAVDAVQASQDRWDSGKKLFGQRLADGFPPAGRPYDVPVHRLNRYVASIQVTRDDFCLLETCQRLLWDGVRNFAFNVPTTHWDGSKVSEEDKQQVLAIAEKLTQGGAQWVRVFYDSLADLFWPGMSRAKLETVYRNGCLTRLRRAGFEHLLVIDGDELFLPGALASVDRYVRWFGPSSLTVDAVPVLGLPGVPVGGTSGRETILCYVDHREKFKDVRSPENLALWLNRNCVIHFSAVRRTREEIITKMRRSGHYDDPDYHFEHWIEHVLPALAPGQNNVHMYKDGGLWPHTREFTAEEWQAIPSRLHPYLWRSDKP